MRGPRPSLEGWGSDNLDAPVLLSTQRDPGEVHDARRSFEWLAGAEVERLALAGWLDAEHLGRRGLDEERVRHARGHHDEVAGTELVFIVVDAVLDLSVEHPHRLRDRVRVDRRPLALDHVDLDQADVLVSAAELPGEDSAAEEPPLLALARSSD